jgi:hypothetical protein
MRVKREDIAPQDADVPPFPQNRKSVDRNLEWRPVTIVEITC